MINKNNHSGNKPVWLIKVGGALIDDEDLLKKACHLIQSVNQTSTVILVHGGGKAVDRMMNIFELPIEKIGGLRKTTSESMDVVTSVLAGVMNKRFVAALAQQGIKSVGISLADGGTVLSRTQPDDPLGLVGIPQAGDSQLLQILLEKNIIPVMSSIGINQHHELVNVNADDAACIIAKMLRVNRLILITDAPGVLNGNKETIDSMTLGDIQGLIDSGAAQGGMIAKLLSVHSLFPQFEGDVFITDIAGFSRLCIDKSLGGGTQIANF